jgi:hypothetical protein
MSNWEHTSAPKPYPAGAVRQAIVALEAARPDTHGAVRDAVDDALDRLYRVRELEEAIRHPYR